MTYPILPLTPTWGNPEQEQADVAKTKYGKAGVEQRDFIGINPLATSWDISVNIRNFQEVDDFLLSRRGQPFRLSLDGGITDDGKFYICTEWQIQQLGVGAGSFNAKINQVRRLVGEGSGRDGIPCQPIIVYYQFDVSSDGGGRWYTYMYPITVYGSIANISTDPSLGYKPDVYLQCQGVTSFGQECGEFGWFGLTGYPPPDFSFRNASIVSITYDY